MFEDVQKKIRVLEKLKICYGCFKSSSFENVWRIEKSIGYSWLVGN